MKILIAIVIVGLLAFTGLTIANVLEDETINVLEDETIEKALPACGGYRGIENGCSNSGCKAKISSSCGCSRR